MNWTYSCCSLSDKFKRIVQINKKPCLNFLKSLGLKFEQCDDLQSGIILMNWTVP